MSKTSNNSKEYLSAVNIPNNVRRRINLSRTSSGKFWFFVDNISCRLEGYAKLYERTIRKEYEKEQEIVGFSKEQAVLHIGCGSYPLTDILLAKIAGIKNIVGIDNDPNAVRYAKEIVTKNKLSEQIFLDHADGQKYPMEKYDVIIVSSCSQPKLKILNHIFRTAKSKSKIIVRELDQAAEPIIKYIKSHKEITILKRIHHNPFPFVRPFGWQTFYLQKK